MTFYFPLKSFFEFDVLKTKKNYLYAVVIWIECMWRRLVVFAHFLHEFSSFIKGMSIKEVFLFTNVNLRKFGCRFLFDQGGQRHLSWPCEIFEEPEPLFIRLRIS